jgi:hypothetical protein
MVIKEEIRREKIRVKRWFKRCHNLPFIIKIKIKIRY